MSDIARSDYYYSDEFEGQLDFLREFGIDANEALIQNTDGVYRGNLLEFKVIIDDVNVVLSQAVKYLSRLRVRGLNVPANILLIDLNKKIIYKFDASDYFTEIHKIYTTSASRSNRGFRAKSKPKIIKDYFGAGAAATATALKENNFVPIEITEDCVVAWAERYYREVPGSTKESFLANDPRKGPLGELKAPKHFQGLILPYKGDDYEAFAHILDRLNDKLKKIELGAFYTPKPYVLKSHELVREAIARVPEGNDYVIIDRCAGSGNLLDGLTAEELEHVIVNTFEQFEYLELAREYGGRVRAVIPPTYKAGDPNLGVLLNGDALSDRFVLGIKDPDGERVPNVIQQYVDDPNCTIILFENPPYAEVAGMEAQKKKRESFGWKGSYVKTQMANTLAKRRDISVVNELSNLFIWSAFTYYLRQPTDSYVVFSPPKYFKSHHLVQKKFVRGFLFNRYHFHATKVAGVSVILWANEDEIGREAFPLTPFDIDRKTGALIAGAAHKANPGPADIIVRPTHKLLSSLYDHRSMPTDVPGIVCETNGSEAFRSVRGTPIWGPDILGYLVAQVFSFENADLNTRLTTAAQYNGNGFYLRRDNYLTKLPLFAAGRLPSEDRFWIRGVVNRCADNGDNFSHDRDFLKSCLIFTALAYHNKCRSFVGSDGRAYRNELCFDAGTQASRDLEQFTLTAQEESLLAQWEVVLEQSRQLNNFDPGKTYGPYQISNELNTKHKEIVGRQTKTVYDFPQLNGDLKTLDTLVKQYHADTVAPFLWKYELVK